MIYKNVCELIGKTPLMELCNFEKNFSLQGRILAKLEFFNPAGSVKDRVALNMIEDAEKKGLLKKGGVIVEPTSGNTGIGLASVGASKGYKVILTMPETMSLESRALLKAYGAEIVLTDGKQGMEGAVKKAKEIAESTENSFYAGQFENPSNPMAHIKTTAKEIWDDCKGEIDIFVAGIGTGGTLSGSGRYLKEKNKNIKIVGVEPADSPLLTKGTAGAHEIQGIGANFIPENLDKGIYDEIIPVSKEDAFETSNFLAKNEGILTGISSGAALYAGKVLAEREENKGKTIVVLLPDSGERYLSINLFR